MSSTKKISTDLNVSKKRRKRLKSFRSQRWQLKRKKEESKRKRNNKMMTSSRLKSSLLATTMKM